MTAGRHLADLPDFLLVAEVAGTLRLSTNGVYSLIRDGALPALRLGRRLVVPKSAIERMVADAVQEVKAPC